MFITAVFTIVPTGKYPDPIKKRKDKFSLCNNENE